MTISTKAKQKSKTKQTNKAYGDSHVQKNESRLSHTTQKN